MRNEHRGKQARNRQDTRRPKPRQERRHWNGGDVTDAPLAGLMKMLSGIGPVPATIGK